MGSFLNFLITLFLNPILELTQRFFSGTYYSEDKMSIEKKPILFREKLHVILCSTNSIRGKENQLLSVEELTRTQVYHLVNQTGFNLPLILSQELEILDGIKRWQIARLKEVEKVPCVLVPNFEDKKLEDTFLHLVTSFRYSLRPIEWYNLLVNEYGMQNMMKEITQENLSKRFGMSRIQSEILIQYIQNNG